MRHNIDIMRIWALEEHMSVATICMKIYHE